MPGTTRGAAPHKAIRKRRSAVSVKSRLAQAETMKDLTVGERSDLVAPLRDPSKVIGMKSPAGVRISPDRATGGIEVRFSSGGLMKAITYGRAGGVDAFVDRVASATPIELVEAEQRGVDGAFLKDLSKRMQITAVRIYDIVGVAKATAEKKIAAKEMIAGAGGQAALGIARLLAIAKDIVENSTAAEAKDFDAAKWLGQWIERPQPALGGRKPADLIGTPTGLEMVVRVLGAIESGAYQ